MTREEKQFTRIALVKKSSKFAFSLSCVYCLALLQYQLVRLCGVDIEGWLMNRMMNNQIFSGLHIRSTCGSFLLIFKIMIYNLS